MPSVKMRRSTRVFVPKTKDGEGVRVLRSGRRLRVESGAAKINSSVQESDGEDLFRLIDDSDEASLASGWRNKVGRERVVDAAVVSGNDGKAEQQQNMNLDKRFGMVFSRKRKRCDPNKNESDYDKMFGLHFSRSKLRRMEVRYLAFEDSSCGFAGVLSIVLRYMWTAKVGIAELTQSEVLSSVSASCRLDYSRYPYKARSFCKIYVGMEFIPLFEVNFTSVPLCFIRMHESMWFRSMLVSSMIFTSSIDLQDADDSEPDDPDENDIYVIYSRRNPSQSTFLNNICSKSDDSGTISKQVARPIGRVVPNRSGIATKPCKRNGVITRACSRYGISTRASNRNGVATRGCHKRRKRSLRTRRARNPSLLGVQHMQLKSSEFDFGIRKSAVKVTSKPQIDDSSKCIQASSSTDDIKLLLSSLHALGKDISTVSCSANLLVVESDKCYRESGACVTLEQFNPNEWHLAVRKDKFLRCYHRAAKGSEVKPNSTNRYTYAIMWCFESGWKLEFTDRRDWAIFKELFKVCGDRNAPPCSMKAIPIPKISEVPLCQISSDVPYSRPESYIKVNDNELSRTLLKETVSYDMDSEDETWLNTFNTTLKDAEIDVPVQVTDDSFEMMIDAFEKAIYNKQDDFTEDLPPADLYLDLANREVLEPVYKYWAQKRKRKGVPLLRVFQLNESKTPFIVKPSLRRKRSIKMRQISKSASSTGRGKQLRILQAKAAERNGIEEENNGMVEVEEAKQAAECATEVAIMKRRRAQALMESADLAMYRASMAVRIAEAATQVAAQPNQDVFHFLD